MQKFCIYERLGCKIPHGLFPAKFTINTTPPPQGVFIMMVPTGRLHPKGASSYGGQAGSQSGHLRSLTAKFKFQLMAKQINNFERAWRDRNKCEIFFGKAQLSLDFWISGHLLLFLETKAHFKMLHLLKQLSLSKVFFTSVSMSSRTWKITYLLCH